MKTPPTIADIFEDIIKELLVLDYVFKRRRSRGLGNRNAQVEEFFRRLVNSIRGWSLVPPTNQKCKTLGIDLVDDSLKVCAFFVIDDKPNKVRETVTAFANNRLDRDYFLLIALSVDERRTYGKHFETNQTIRFSSEGNIWDIDELLCWIEQMEFQRIMALRDYIGSAVPPLLAALTPSESPLFRSASPSYRKAEDIRRENSQRSVTRRTKN